MPSSRWRLRPADLGDLDELVELDEETYGLEALTRDQLRHLVHRSPSEVLVAETRPPVDGSSLAGALILGLRRGRRHGRIESLVVRREQRRLGLGRLLLRKALSLSRQLDLDRVVLEVEPRNRHAITLYRQEGFDQVEIVEDYYGTGRDAIRMQRCVD